MAHRKRRLAWSHVLPFGECKGLGDHHIVDKVLRSLQALSMSSPFQPGSTVSLSTSCCTLKASTLPVAIVQAPPRDPVVEFVGHLQRNGDSCGAADKSITMNTALVSPAVTETLLHETRSAPQTVLSTTTERERNQCRRKGRVNLKSRSRRRRQGAIGVFTLCRERNRLSRS